MAEKHNTRIDKWLWAVRIFKTRAQATEACAGGKVKIDGTAIKASRKIKLGETLLVRKGVIKYMYKVLKITEKRMGAKHIIDFIEDLTPDDERAKLKSSHKQPLQTREKGQGRPTKKERRIMDEIREKY
jgi:ribosome-associated heat shock protein Hsp15